jgi:acetyltransferase-like isoleucine patch superfamily enzyme
MGSTQRNADERSRREMPREAFLTGFKNRILQSLARSMPGAFTFRVWAHRHRGVSIGTGVHIGPDVMIDTAFPQWVAIGNNVQLGTRCLILAHVHTLPPRKSEHATYISVRIEDDVYVGAGAIILPNVSIGRGAVVTAGSVVTRSIPAMVMVQGNPAEPVARCGVPLTWDMPLKTFYAKLKPLDRNRTSVAAPAFFAHQNGSSPATLDHDGDD